MCFSLSVVIVPLIAQAKHSTGNVSVKLRKYLIRELHSASLGGGSRFTFTDRVTMRISAPSERFVRTASVIKKTLAQYSLATTRPCA